jgi:tryptophanyl-tRNA synthetase
MRAVTDTGPTEPGMAPSEPVKNLFTIMSAVSDRQTVDFFKEKHSLCEIRYGDMKKQLAEDIIKFTEPIRNRIKDILANNKYLSRVVSEGSEKARASASKTVREVREIIGYRPF